MTKLFDKLNLRPNERRLIVIIGVVVFVVLNIWWVLPRFSEWSKLQGDLAQARATLAQYQEKIARTDSLAARLRELEGDGAAVLAGEQQIELVRTVLDQANAARVRVHNYNSIPSRTQSEYFEEQALKIDVNTGEQELVTFLVNVGSGSSMIRVRDMRLNPDRNRHRLEGSLTLTASYQKTPGRSTAPAARAGGAPGTARSRP